MLALLTDGKDHELCIDVSYQWLRAILMYKEKMIAYGCARLYGRWHALNQSGFKSKIENDVLY